ncbi:hypothetical protein [Paraburkholderia piptadeniae]|nr:hypothetical protein [Paraburkholderia piptadeniae]
MPGLTADTRDRRERRYPVDYRRTGFISSHPCRYTGMEKKTSLQILQSAHRAALAIASARIDLSVRDQEILYDKVFLGLLEDSIRIMSIEQLLDVLAT